MERAETNLERLRTARNLTIAELAKQAGVSRQTVWMVERKGQSMTLDTARKLARALNVPLEQL